MRKPAFNQKKAPSASQNNISAVNDNGADKEGTVMSTVTTSFIEAVKAGIITTADLEALLAAKAAETQNVEPVAEDPVEEVPKAEQKQHWTKAYSRRNVDIIRQMIERGETSDSICERFGICKSTIKNYIFKRYEETNRRGIAVKLWEKLLENDRMAKENASNTTSREAVEQAPEKIDFVIDPQLIQRHDGRKFLFNAIERLHAEGCSFIIFSKGKMEEIINYSPTGAAAECARECMEQYKVADTEETILWRYAKSIGATVLTGSEVTMNVCNRFDTECLTIEELLSENEDYSETSVEEAKKYNIPCRMNNNRRVICKVADVIVAIRELFNLDSVVEVAISNKDGASKSSPTGEIRLVKGDYINFCGEISNMICEGKLEIVAESTKDNAVLRLYIKYPNVESKSSNYATA